MRADHLAMAEERIRFLQNVIIQRDAESQRLTREIKRLRAALVDLLSWLPAVDMDKNYTNDGRSAAIQKAREAIRSCEAPSLAGGGK